MTGKKKPADCLNQPMIEGRDNRVELFKRITAILDHYEIERRDPGFERKLLIAVLSERWAGFRTKKPGGNPRKHSFEDMMWVHMDFHRIKAECPPGTKDPAVWRKMANDPFYKEQDLTFDALKGIFNRSRDPKVAHEILRASDAFMTSFLEAGRGSFLTEEQVAEIEEAVRKKN